MKTLADSRTILEGIAIQMSDGVDVSGVAPAQFCNISSHCREISLGGMGNLYAF